MEGERKKKMAENGMTAIQLYILPREKNMGGCREKGNPRELEHKERSKVRTGGWGKKHKQKREVGRQERENGEREKQKGIKEIKGEKISGEWEWRKKEVSRRNKVVGVIGRLKNE